MLVLSEYVNLVIHCREGSRAGSVALRHEWYGFMAIYQPYVAEAVGAPVLMSNLLQVPLALSSAGSTRQTGIIRANIQARNTEHLIAVGMDET